MRVTLPYFAPLCCSKQFSAIRRPQRTGLGGWLDARWFRSDRHSWKRTDFRVTKLCGWDIFGTGTRHWRGTGLTHFNVGGTGYAWLFSTGVGWVWQLKSNRGSHYPVQTKMVEIDISVMFTFSSRRVRIVNNARFTGRNAGHKSLRCL